MVATGKWQDVLLEVMLIVCVGSQHILFQFVKCAGLNGGSE